MIQKAKPPYTSKEDIGKIVHYIRKNESDSDLSVGVVVAKGLYSNGWDYKNIGRLLYSQSFLGDFERNVMATLALRGATEADDTEISSLLIDDLGSFRASSANYKAISIKKDSSYPSEEMIEQRVEEFLSYIKK
jgi:hypothetical protein